MSERPANMSARGYLIAWAIAAALVGLLMLPILRVKDTSPRPPGLVDVGTPGFGGKVSRVPGVRRNAEPVDASDDLYDDGDATGAETDIPEETPAGVPAM